MKTVAVFGGSGGVGKLLCPLLEEKYSVLSLSSKDVDVTDFSQVEEFFNSNNIDVVVSLSGVNYDSKVSKITENNLQEVNKLLSVNINGNINILSNSINHMIPKRYGRIIGISSVLSDITVPSTALYSASKSFMDKMYEVANKENLKYGITCNTIQLGYWEAGMIEQLSDDFRKSVENSIGLRRFGKIQELFNAIDFIIDTEYYCGNKMKLNGGL